MLTKSLFGMVGNYTAICILTDLAKQEILQLFHKTRIGNEMKKTIKALMYILNIILFYSHIFGVVENNISPKVLKLLSALKDFFLLKYSMSNRYGMNDSKNPIIDGRATGHSGADSHFMFYRISI